MEHTQTNPELIKWQRRLGESESAYQEELEKMDDREALYRGQREITPLTEKDKSRKGENWKTPHVRNIIAENIESQVNSAIPQPKVTARRQKDEHLAKLIEDMIRNELNRMPFEYINDMQERTVPLQGGSFYHIEWDNNKRTHTTVGEIVVNARHPKQVIPQEGVYTSVEDMDYIILKIPTTKEAIKRRYGVDVAQETEEEPEIRAGESKAAAKPLVTQYIGYYRNSKGGVGKYSWVCDTELEHLEDYQARRLRRCKDCGELEPMDGDEFVGAMEMTIPDAFAAGNGETPGVMERARVWHSGDPCPHCGGKHWESREEEYQELWNTVRRSDGTELGGSNPVFNESTGEVRYEPTRVPYYKPDLYPVVLQRNVSIFGRLLGDSDVDKIEDQQNTINRLEKKIIDRLVTAGSRIIMPGKSRHKIDTTDTDVWYVEDVQDASMIQVKDFTGNLQYELAYLAQVYEESRQAIGITDSFQGRSDTTAKSGVAKQFAAAQSAGRMESKRVMKDTAYADIFQSIFRFMLAYADEPRPVVSQDSKGNRVYREFCKWDFLEQDEAGEWYWNDQFLFSTDASAPLANNRERMWEETISLFSAGCFGAPTELETLIALWTKLELLHYPGAGDTREYLEEKLQTQRAAAGMQQMPQSGGVTQQTNAAVDEQARQDAMRAVFGNQVQIPNG